jgi:tRNA-dihydrouridine synthase B
VTTPFPILTLQHQPLTPPFLLAPMAGITHSAFRRLVARFGGYGALFTEMLPVASLLTENAYRSPMLKRRVEEGPVIYQIVVTDNGSIEDAVRRLMTIEPFAIDINLGCPAPMISRKGGGKALFDDALRLTKVLDTIRSLWHGPLSVKCRLGHETPDWQETFLSRIELFRSIGIDALTVHPRFFHEKLKRKARWNLFPWIRSMWQLPLIGNGDMINGEPVDLLRQGTCDALMFGRIAIRKPWIFKELSGNVVTIDYFNVWNDFYHYALDDFPPEKAIGRIREFTAFFAENFFFGHELFRISRAAKDLEELHRRVKDFLQSNPKLMK